MSLTLSTKKRVVGQLEVLLSMRLQTQRFPYSLNGGLGEVGLGGEGTARPVRGPLRWVLESRMNQSGDLLIAYRPRTPGAQFIVEPHQALLAETTAPLANRSARQPKMLTDLLIGEPLIAHQDDLGSPHMRMRQATGTGHGFELGTNFVTEGERLQGTSQCH